MSAWENFLAGLQPVLRTYARGRDVEDQARRGRVAIPLIEAPGAPDPVVRMVQAGVILRDALGAAAFRPNDETAPLYRAAIATALDVIEGLSSEHLPR